MTIHSYISSFFRHFKYGDRLNPVRDWLALIVSSVIVCTGIIVWNMWVFDTVAQGGVIGSVATSSLSVFDRSSLDAIDAIFANRAAEEEKYETGAYRFADPSQ